MDALTLADQRLSRLIKTSDTNNIMDNLQDASGSALETAEQAGQQILDWAKQNPEEAAGILGASGGAAAAGITSDDNRLANALIGALLGGSVGYGGAHAVNEAGGAISDKVQGEEGLSDEAKQNLGIAGGTAGAVAAGGLGAKYFDDRLNPERKASRHARRASKHLEAGKQLTRNEDLSPGIAREIQQRLTGGPGTEALSSTDEISGGLNLRSTTPEWELFKDMDKNKASILDKLKAKYHSRRGGKEADRMIKWLNRVNEGSRLARKVT